MMRISWTEKLTYEVVMEKDGAESEPRRGGGIEKKNFRAEVAGKRVRGRQRLKMLDWMMERLRVKDGIQLGNVTMKEKDGEKEDRHDPSTVFDAKTLEE